MNNVLDYMWFFSITEYFYMYEYIHLLRNILTIIT